MLSTYAYETRYTESLQETSPCGCHGCHGCVRRRDGQYPRVKTDICQICTEVLYQPLTLLDCLHTFCGSCLKPWFSLQADRATSLHPYTCPSCRAPVRETRPNATVTTLLDMFLQANPDRDRTKEEKEDMDKIFKHGDTVLPKLRKREEPQEQEDRRLIDEVRELSLQEVGVSSTGLDAPRQRRGRDRSRDRRDRDVRQQDSTTTTSRVRGSQQTQYRAAIPQRQVEHQASLRSLLSSSDVDSQEIEDEIMRQIMEEGLLDGIDLTNIDVTQEDEISERIAEAYRRRQRERETERARSRQTRDVRSNSTNPSPSHGRSDDAQRRRQRGDVSATQPTQDNRPPASRPHLLEAVNDGEGRSQARSSSHGSSTRTPYSDRVRGLSASSTTQASRSAIDLSDRPRISQPGTERERRVPLQDRRSTDPDRPASEQWRNAVAGVVSNANQSSSPRRAVFGTTSTASPPSLQGPFAVPTDRLRGTRRQSETSSSRPARPTNNSTPSLVSPQAAEARQRVDDERPSSSSGAAAAAPVRRPHVYPEPVVVCDRCGKPNVQYDVHFNCHKCHSGNYNLCLSCYRQGRGCLNWWGFGHAAMYKYENNVPPGGHPANYQDQPHVLAGQQYLRPAHDPILAGQQAVTEDNPTRRLRKGVFCAMCSAYANSCYWRCDICNDGEWGFCNDCTNQGRHCTHPLLPLTHISTHKPDPHNQPENSPTSSDPPSSVGITPKSASILRGPSSIPLANTLFRPLTFSTQCDICHYPIPPSNSRFHCPQCNNGDYDICTPCYTSLVKTNRIAPQNGHQGWRRCLRGHRMVIVGFEDRDGGQRRIVSREIVGGHALKEEDDDPATARRPRNNNASDESQAQQTPNWSWRDADGTIRKSRPSAHRTGSIPNSTTESQTQSQSQSISQPPSSSQHHQQRFPPDGGVGIRARALWSYYPAEGVRDELMFPKGAEVRECEDINGDWFWGVYAGGKGVFPGAFVRGV